MPSDVLGGNKLINNGENILGRVKVHYHTVIIYITPATV